VVRRADGVKPFGRPGFAGLTPSAGATDLVPRRGKPGQWDRAQSRWEPVGSGRHDRLPSPYERERIMSATSSPIHPAPNTVAEVEIPTLSVVAWRDPVVESLPGSISTASDHALVWWTPIVGPTGILMAHRFATYAADGPSEWTVADVTATFGMGNSRGRLVHTLTRLERFGIVSCRGSEVAVRLMLAPLTRRQQMSLPGYLADAFDD